MPGKKKGPPKVIIYVDGKRWDDMTPEEKAYASQKLNDQAMAAAGYVREDKK